MICICVVLGCEAQSNNKFLLALSKADHTLAIVDPVSLKVLAKLPVGIDPHEVIASSNGKIAYVAIYGGGTLHEINVLDLVNRKALPNIDTRPLYGPHDVAYVQDKLWFTDPDGNAWEIFTVHEQLEITGQLSQTGCCVPKKAGAHETATCGA